MTTLVDQFKQALSALAYADIGERIGRREKHAALFPELASHTAPSNPATGTSRKWIALGVGDSLPPHVMAYVIGACRRMQANLLLLSCDAMQVRVLLADYLPELQGIYLRNRRTEQRDERECGGCAESAPRFAVRSVQRRKRSLAPAAASASRPALAGAGGAGDAKATGRPRGRQPEGRTNVSRCKPGHLREPSSRLLYLAISLIVAALLWLNHDLILDLPLFK
jgi:hypothetical protein